MASKSHSQSCPGWRQRQDMAISRKYFHIQSSTYSIPYKDVTQCQACQWGSPAVDIGGKSQQGVGWRRGLSAQPQFGSNWMAWQGKCQPLLNPSELGVLLAYATVKYRSVLTAMRTADNGQVFTHSKLGVPGKTQQINMKPARKDFFFFVYEYKSSLQTASAGYSPICE